MDIEFIDIVKFASGKIKSGSDISSRTNKISHKSHSYFYKKKPEHTEAQKRTSKFFGNCGHQAGLWLKSNHPTPENPQGTPNYQLYIKEFRSQNKVSNQMAYITQKMQQGLWRY